MDERAPRLCSKEGKKIIVVHMIMHCVLGILKHHYTQSSQELNEVDVNLTRRVEKLRFREGWDTPQVTHKQKQSNSELLHRGRLR